MTIATFELEDFKVEISCSNGRFKVVEYQINPDATNEIVYFEIFCELTDAFEKFAHVVIKYL